MILSRKKLVLAAVACIVIAPLPILTGMGEASPSGLAALFASLPITVWMGLAIMAALVIASWLSIDADDDAGETRP